MKHLILTLSCKDRKGIIAQISEFLYKIDANIVTADQYSTADEEGTFFFRCEFCVQKEQYDVSEFQKRFHVISDTLDAQWELYDSQKKIRMGILVSKPDHCLHELLYRWKAGDLNVEIPMIISNHPDHEALAVHYDIPYFMIPARSEDRHENKILEKVSASTDFLVLARYMQILTGNFLKTYKRPVINIHHSFLPSFRGANPYAQALDRGVKVIGATAHYVTEELDEGAIICQSVKSVTHKETVEDLKHMGKDLEKLGLYEAVRLHVRHQILIWKNKTIIF